MRSRTARYPASCRASRESGVTPCCGRSPVSRLLVLVATGALPSHVDTDGPWWRGCLHYRATSCPLDDLHIHRHRLPGAARRQRGAKKGNGATGAAGGGGQRGRGRCERSAARPRSGTVVERSLVVDRRPGRRGRPGLRPAAGRAAGGHHPRHQDVPVSRPDPFLSQVAFMWNPTVGLGTVNHQYIGYLLPMGPFFAVFHLLGVPGLGGAAAVAGHDPLRRRARGPLSVPHPRAEGAGADGGRAGLHAVALLPAVRRADLGDPAAVGGPAVHAGPDHRGAAPGRLAGAGAVRLRRGAGERHQRELGHLHRRRADPVALLRGGRAARVDLAPRARHRRCASRS